jgi:hypothetical protein
LVAERAGAIVAPTPDFARAPTRAKVLIAAGDLYKIVHFRNPRGRFLTLIIAAIV